MKQLKTEFSFIVIMLLFSTGILNAQLNENSELFQILKANDSLLFERSFNQCETKWLNKLIAEDFEFYHDISGVNNSKQEFINVMNSGICNPKNETKSRRELVNGSLKVYALKNNGSIYGALQIGKHRFYESYKNNPEQAGSIALFSHLWILENNNSWRLKRVISYDHKMPNQ